MELQTIPTVRSDRGPRRLTADGIALERDGSIPIADEDPCERFLRELTALRDQADDQARDTLLRGAFDLIGLGFLYDLAKDDDELSVALAVAFDLLAAGAIAGFLYVLGWLAQRLGIATRVAKVLKRFAGPFALVLLAIDIGLLIYGYATRYDALDRFLPSFEATFTDCPEAERKRIIAGLGLGR